MLILLYGPDSYRRSQRFKELVSGYVKKYSGLSCNFFDLEKEGDFTRLKEFSKQLSMFDSKRLAVVKDIFTVDLKELKKFLVPHISSEGFIIIISEETLPPKGFDFLAKKSSSVDKFDELSGVNLKSFIQKEAQKRGIKLAPPAFNFLVQEFSKNTWGLVNELEKLSLKNEKFQIDLADIIEVGDYHQAPNLFVFLNMIIQNSSLKQKISSLEELFLNQEEPAKIFNILASRRQLPLKILQNLADYDVMVKSGKIEYEEVLVDLALS